MNKFIKLHTEYSGNSKSCSFCENDIYLSIDAIVYISYDGRCVYLKDDSGVGLDEESFIRLLSAIKDNIIGEE